MTLFAPVGSDALPGGMAQGTFLFKGRVGREIGEWGLSRPRFCQWPGVKRDTTPQKEDDDEKHNK